MDRTRSPTPSGESASPGRARSAHRLQRGQNGRVPGRSTQHRASRTVTEAARPSSGSSPSAAIPAASSPRAWARPPAGVPVGHEDDLYGLRLADALGAAGRLPHGVDGEVRLDQTSVGKSTRSRPDCTSRGWQTRTSARSSTFMDPAIWPGARQPPAAARAVAGSPAPPARRPPSSQPRGRARAGARARARRRSRRAPAASSRCAS